MKSKKNDNGRKMKIWGIVLIVCGIIAIFEGGILFIIPGLILYCIGRKKSKHNTSQEPPQESPQPKIDYEQARKNREQYLSQFDIKTHKVAGVTQYIDNIMTLASDNLDYDLSKRELFDENLLSQRVYQYDFYPSKVELIPEPDNQYDNKAIKVIVEGVHVGYIKSGSCSHIHNLLNNNRIHKIEVEMGYGKYKVLHDNRDDYDQMENKYVGSDLELEKDETPPFVHLKIWEIKQ